jgi:CRISPR-associated protein (TIGR03986 family)
MLETGHGGVTPRKNHYVIAAPSTASLLKIDDRAIADYRAGLTDFQKQQPFDERLGMLQDGRPVFYCQPASGQTAIFFGQSPNFRIPYRPVGSPGAASPADFVPKGLINPDMVDLAEAIFGYVRRGTQAGGEQMCAGRVFVGDATLDPPREDVWLNEQQPVFTPRILASPKPTTFQHYLVQTSAARRELKHYASQPGDATVIRGHKLYWHKGPVGYAQIAESDQSKIEKARSQYTEFKPVKPGVAFTFEIRFENLSQVELGALLWVLQVAADERYRLKLGMGKPLGMGSIRIDHRVSRDERGERYGALFNGETWESGARVLSDQEREACIAAFERYVLAGICAPGSSLHDVLRIQCLLALLTWHGPNPANTRYMEIERDAEHPDGYVPSGRPRSGKVNEYGERPVLPTPLQVLREHGGMLAGAVADPQPASVTTAPEVYTGTVGGVNYNERSAAVIVPGIGALKPRPRFAEGLRPEHGDIVTVQRHSDGTYEIVAIK